MPRATRPGLRKIRRIVITVRIKAIHVKDFKRFADLRIENIPETARLVVLAGPNGFGKSSLFDAMVTAHNTYAGRGNAWNDYYARHPHASQQVPQVTFHSAVGNVGPGNHSLFYFRTAYRNEPDVRVQRFEQLPPLVEERRFARMSDNDVAVSRNFQRLVGAMLEDVTRVEPGSTTFDEYRKKHFAALGDAMARLFPDLRLDGLDNPMEQGTFHFTKGATRHYPYLNLSGGEKAAFDLLLDIVQKRRKFSNSIYCVDEPELHLNPSLHGALLEASLSLIPEACQLWIATHSIGMMRKAIEMEHDKPGSVAFIDFGSKDFDQAVTLVPVTPTRSFWMDSLRVALDDLAELVGPSMIVVCEGCGAASNSDHDATCYNTIFAAEYPEVLFISGGNAHEVQSDRLQFVRMLPRIISGIGMRRLIDRDDHAPADVARLQAEGIRVLARRNLEAYLWDDEVLKSLCSKFGQQDALVDVLQLKQDAMANVDGAPDDFKPAAGLAYVAIKKRLGLSAVGNTSRAFERETLAPLIQPGMSIYSELRMAVFD